MTVYHDVKIFPILGEKPGSGFYQAECICGWKGPERPMYEDDSSLFASIDANKHRSSSHEQGNDA